MILDSTSKLVFHYEKINELFTKGKTYPIHITIGLTNYCNHKCTWCYIDYAKDIKHQINADIDKMIDALTIAKKYGTKAITLVGDGEPTLHPQFDLLLEKVNNLGLDIGIFTNGGWKKKSITDSISKYCRFVRFSVDAGSEEIHNLTHLTRDFSVVLSNIGEVVKNKSKYLTVGVQFAFNQDNINDIEKAAKVYRDLEVDYLAYKPVYKNSLNDEHKENSVESNNTYEKLSIAKTYETDKFKVYWKNWQLDALIYKKEESRGYNKCRAIWLSPYFDENGNVEFCGNLKGRGFTIGNIYEQSFDKIWMSEKHLEKVNAIDLETCPQGCKLHGLNLKLESIANPDLNQHINFV